MSYIELIGPHSVGKTTLLKRLVSKRKKEKETKWKKYEETISDILDSLEWHELQNMKCRALYLAYKLNFTGYKKVGIRNTLIKKLTPDISNKVQKKYEYLIESQFKALASLDENISPINKCTLLNWHKKALEKLWVLEALQYQKTVVFDEGPLKTHFGLHQIDLDQMKKTTLPKAVINCTCSIEENLKRVKNRINQTGNVLKIHNGLNNKDLEYLVGYTHAVANKNTAFLESIGLPILNVDLTDPIKDSDLEKISLFLKKHSSITFSSMDSIKVHIPKICI